MALNMENLVWFTRVLNGAAPAHDPAPSTDHAPSTDGHAPATAYNITPALEFHPHAGGHKGPSDNSIALGDGWLALQTDDCYCAGWYVSHGTSFEQTFAITCQWSLFAICIMSLLWYAYQYWKATTGWEEVYVCCIELVMICFEIYHEFDSPCTLYLSTGNMVNWLRYSEWLLCCPVILIHLSNITGLSDEYSKRTMGLLVSDIGTIVFGVYSAMLVGWPKIIFYIIALLMCSYTFYLSAQLLIEAYHMVPKGICRILIKCMAVSFFVGWSFFPLIFLFGKPGFKKLSPYADVVASSFGDLISKNLFGMLGHFLRVKIHEHILKHGDIRKTTHVRIAGEEKEVETFVEEEDEDTVKHSTKELANRGSFIVMRDNMRAKGIDVRASLDMEGDEEAGGRGKAGFAGAGMPLVPGRVILAVPDISMVDFFHEHFSSLNANIELVPALGADNTMLLVQQAMQLGGLDFVLVHPEFLRDRSQSGLVPRLKSMGHGVCAFGWVPSGPVRDLIESSGLDGWLEGPSFGSGIDQVQLAELVGMMQQKRKFAAKFGAFGAPNFNSGKSGLELAPPSPSHGSGLPLLQNMSPQNSMRIPAVTNGMVPNPMIGTQVSMSNPMLSSQNSTQLSGNMMMPTMGMMNGQPAASNPLYGAPPSPLSSQPGAQYVAGGTPLQPMSSQPVASGSGNEGSEAEMLKQLMKEINRLKAELGES